MRSVSLEVARAVLRKGVRGGLAVDGGKIGEIGDGSEHAFDVSGVVEIAQEALRLSAGSPGAGR